MNQDLADRLLGCLEEKASLLAEIAEVTAEQTALIGLEDINPLLDNIERRQRLIDRINELDIGVADAANEMGQPQDTPQWAALTDKLAALNERMRSKLEAIQENDRHNEQLATQQLQSFQNELRTLHQGARSVNAYSSIPQSAEGRYIDKKNV